ncbi:hypothetical protein EB796_014129 [Bugula neritina]|uniref:Uncharacterized protein n=1 Tax=Bugula neritina TaxID=10212 RepID=A0A7J7JNU6_BUGNE|nr:hypothetical protein EB796_014129 [Bugula neritina]
MAEVFCSTNFLYHKLSKKFWTVLKYTHQLPEYQLLQQINNRVERLNQHFIKSHRGVPITLYNLEVCQ